MAHMIKAAAAAAAAAATASPAPLPPPTWPPTFNVSFTEVTSDVLQNTTFTGAMYYDFPGRLFRIDRSSGKTDRYCGSVKSEDTPCTHLVSAGERYLVFPDLSYCCKCCNDAQGCGIVSPDWMVQSNGTYLGRAPLTTPVWSGVADSWDVEGLQPNVWAQDKAAAPVQLAMEPNDYFFYDPSTWVPNAPQPATLFAVPSYCTGQCPLLSTCSFVRERESAARPFP